jgi:hypothetical protein
VDVTVKFKTNHEQQKRRTVTVNQAEIDELERQVMLLKSHKQERNKLNFLYLNQQMLSP